MRLPSPAQGDLDSAWMMVLVYAQQHGLQFGPDIAFTFGPLGFLLGSVYIDSVPQIKLLWETGGNFAFALTAVAVGASFGPIRFSIYYASLLLAAVLAPDPFTSFAVPLLVLGWVFPTEAKPWQIAVAVFWIAFFSAIRFNYLLLAVAGIALVSAYHFYRRQWRKPLALVSGFTTTFLLLWVFAGQAIGNLPLYLMNSWELSRGYVAAMQLNRMAAGAWVAALSLWVLLAAFAFDLVRKRKWGIELPMLAYLGLAWFLFWKHGFTRADEGHVLIFFTAAAVLMAAVPGFFGTPRQLSVLDFGPVVCLVGLWLCHPSALSATPQTLQQRLHENRRDLYKPQRYAKRFAIDLRRDRKLRGKPDLPPMVGRETIDVFGHDQHEALREKLNYHPRPVFQSYIAYTAALLRQNLRFYESEDAPQFVFARLGSVDQRYPAQDDRFARGAPSAVFSRAAGRGLPAAAAPGGATAGPSLARTLGYPRGCVWGGNPAAGFWKLRAGDALHCAQASTAPCGQTWFSHHSFRLS